MEMTGSYKLLIREIMTNTRRIERKKMK